jgi:hypothetical protein
MRREVLSAAEPDSASGGSAILRRLEDMIAEEVGRLVSLHTGANYPEEWNLEEITENAAAMAVVPGTLREELGRIVSQSTSPEVRREEIRRYVAETLKILLAERTRSMGQPVMANLAKAVIITGDAELAEVGSGKMVRIEAGPWHGEYTPEQAVAMIASRYPLSTRDGALGFTRESYRELFARPDIQESQIFKDNISRVLTKLIPKKIQAWDFSKAPIGNVSDQ